MTDLGDGRIRVLVTNDDGVTAPGLVALARAAVSLGHDVIVAAPSRDQSGTSAGVAPAMAQEGIGLTPVELDGAEGLTAHAVDGPPALAVLAAHLGGLGPAPSIVASGVNHGPNCGYSVLHSGTVGAALTAANFGISGLAVSIDAGRPQHLDTATAVARAALSWLVAAPAGTVLNVNLPDLPVERLAGVRWASLATFGQVQSAVRENEGGSVQVEISGGPKEHEPGTDSALLAAGFVTVTSITAVQATAPNDAPRAIEASLSR